MAVKKPTATNMYSNRKLNQAAHFIKENPIFIYFFPSENSSSLTMAESVPAPSFFSITHLAVHSGLNVCRIEILVLIPASLKNTVYLPAIKSALDCHLMPRTHAFP